MKSSLLGTFLLCASLLALGACGKGKQKGPPKTQTPEVGVITVQPQSSALTRELVGRLSAYRSADVRARVAGVLIKRDYEEGSDVKQGQLLFEIDPAPLKAAMSVAQASLAQVQATYTNNKVAAGRIHDLAPKGFVSKSDVDNADAAERTAAAAVQAARANLETARINLGYAHVTAPIAGRADEQQVTEGALVGSGTDTLLTTITQIDPLYVNFTMSVDALEEMRQAQRNGHVTLAAQDKASVQITLPDGSPYADPGSVDFSAATVNPATGSVNLRAIVPNPKHTLLPGMYVTIKAELGQQHMVFLVPQQAVQRDTVGAYVLTVGPDDKVVRNDVTSADMIGGDWVVTSGLRAGEKVVVSGIQNAKAGEPARPTAWRAGGPAPATTIGNTPRGK
ncbi:MAG: efflux RND transporter periplasmic adaptor subunit [Rhodanobacter sp.]